MGRTPQILWRRLDRPGHDACRLWQDGERQGLEGAAVWQDEAGPAHLAYEVTCGPDWTTRSARVQGRVGERDLTLSIHRGAVGDWHVNGEELPDLAGLPDVDLGFTPATNTLPLLRLRALGRDRAELAAVWLDTADWTLKSLPQTYERHGDGWRYTSHLHDFTADLTVDRYGFVTDYPGLWTKED